MPPITVSTDAGTSTSGRIRHAPAYARTPPGIVECIDEALAGLGGGEFVRCLVSA